MCIIRVRTLPLIPKSLQECTSSLQLQYKAEDEIKHNGTHYTRGGVGTGLMLHQEEISPDQITKSAFKSGVYSYLFLTPDET